MPFLVWRVMIPKTGCCKFWMHAAVQAAHTYEALEGKITNSYYCASEMGEKLLSQRINLLPCNFLHFPLLKAPIVIHVQKQPIRRIIFFDVN